MADKIRVNYPALEDMARQCREAANRLRQTVATANRIATQMEQGAMQGEFGDTFADALKGVFSQKVRKLSEKLDEEANDIQGAINDMKNADSQAGGKF